MRLSLVLFATAAAFSLAGVTSTAQAQDRIVEDEEAAANENERSEEVDRSQERVCRSMQITGTRFRERVCRTRQEWDEGREAMREVSEEMRRDGADLVETGPNGPVASPQ